MRKGNYLAIIALVVMTCGSAMPYSEVKAEPAVQRIEASYHFREVTKMMPAYAFPSEYAARIAELNATLQIPEVVLGRLIEWESGWNASCVRANPNGSTDFGLMQLNSCYLADYRWRYNDDRAFDPLDPDDNLAVGMRYLRHLYDVTGNWYDAVCAYNAGLSRVRAGEVPEKTVLYANWVLEEGGL